MLTDGFVSGRAGNVFFPVFSILPTHGPFILRTFSLTKSSFIIIVLMIIEMEKYVLCSKEPLIQNIEHYVLPVLTRNFKNYNLALIVFTLRNCVLTLD